LLPCSLKSFFLLLLENAIAKRKILLKLGASSEARKEIQAWWTLQRRNSVYKKVPQGIEWSQQEEDGYPEKARFNEAGRNSQGFFLHTQARNYYNNGIIYAKKKT
jgi:hypothetical protein